MRSMHKKGRVVPEVFEDVKPEEENNVSGSLEPDKDMDNNSRSTQESIVAEASTSLSQANGSTALRKSLSALTDLRVSTAKKNKREFYKFSSSPGVHALRRYVDIFLGEGRGKKLSTSERVKLRIRELLDENSHTTRSMIVGIIILTIILLSSITFVLETTKAIKENEKVMDVFEELEYMYIVFFTLEIGFRLYAYVSTFEDFFMFFRNLQNVIDIAAIVPSYLNYIISNDNLDLRFLRLTRVFRVVRLTKLGPKVQVVFDALTEAQDVLIMLLMNLMIIVVIFSSITYYFEKDESCENHRCFSSIPETCWWAIVTVLTVGYGDMYPTSLPGKVAATILMILSLVVLALPITIIGTTFSKAWERSKKNSAKMDSMNTQQISHARYICQEVDKLKRSFVKSLDKVKEKIENAKAALCSLEDNLKEGNLNEQTKFFKILMESTPALKSILRTQHNIEAVDEMCALVQTFKTYRNEMVALMEETGEVLIKAQDVKTKLMKSLSEKMPEMYLGKSAVKVHEFEYVAVVHIYGASELSARDLNGTSDPYVIVSSGEQQARTRVVHKSLSPYFDETLAIFVRKKTLPICFSMFDHDEFTEDDPMGNCSIDISNFKLCELYVFNKEMEGNKCTGKMTFSVVLRDISDQNLMIGVDPIYRSVAKTLLGVDLHGQKVVQLF